MFGVSLRRSIDCEEVKEAFEQTDQSPSQNLNVVVAIDASGASNVLKRSSAFNLSTMCSSSSQGTVDEESHGNCQSLDPDEELQSRGPMVPQHMTMR